MSGRKSRSLNQIKSISRRARKTIRAQIDKQHEENKEIIFLTKQLMKKFRMKALLMVKLDQLLEYLTWLKYT